MANSEFIIDIEAIKKAARTNISKGAVTKNYSLNLDTVIDLLNGALATEIICTLRYKKHYHKATELGASIAASEFLEHSQQEDEHASKLAERIQQLGGEPNLDPSTLTGRSHADYVDCDSLKDMITENLVAERIAIDIYREIIRYLGNEDSTTRNVIESILATEEEHADDLMDVAAEYNITLN